MKFECLLVGVGGGGVLTSQVIIARAANLAGHFVRGFQLRGLAQRGGSIAATARFGKQQEISSPEIMPASADLVLAFEPQEAVRAAFFARKEKTVFVVDGEVPKDKLLAFAKKVYTFSATQAARENFKNPILGNAVLLGAACGLGVLPLAQENLIEALKITAPRNLSENLSAFALGFKNGKLAP